MPNIFVNSLGLGASLLGLSSNCTTIDILTEKSEIISNENYDYGESSNTVESLEMTAGCNSELIASVSDFNKKVEEYEVACQVADYIVSLIENSLIDEKLEDKFISFVDKMRNDISFLKALSIFFSKDSLWEKQCWFLDTVLMSDIDVFSPWYKMVLIIGSNSKNEPLSFMSRDILTHYHKRFDSITVNVFD